MSDNRKFTDGAYSLPAPEPEPAPTVKWDGITWVPCDGPQAPPQPSGYSGGWVFQGGQFVPLASPEANDDTVIATECHEARIIGPARVLNWSDCRVPCNADTITVLPVVDEHGNQVDPEQKPRTGSILRGGDAHAALLLRGVAQPVVGFEFDENYRELVIRRQAGIASVELVRLSLGDTIRLHAFLMDYAESGNGCPLVGQKGNHVQSRRA
jgi:hypothetical protein